jgi:hypothetical protein
VCCKVTEKRDCGQAVGWESEKGLRAQGAVDAYMQAYPRDLQIDGTPRD